MSAINGYKLMRSWFDFAFENQDIVNPNHTALFAWLVELNNRMGWAEKFANPAGQAMAAIGMKSYNSYKNTYDDLITFGFVIEIVKSRNQYQACIIALSELNKANVKALAKAIDNANTEQMPRQSEDTVESNDSIIKPKTRKPRNPKPETLKVLPSLIATGKEKGLFDIIKKIFIKIYEEKNKSGEYYFKPVDGKKLTLIIEQLFFKIKEKDAGKNEAFALEKIKLDFELFFNSAYDTGTDFIKKNFTLSIIEQQFNSIYKAVKDGKQTKPGGAGASAKASNLSVIDEISKRVGNNNGQR